ncbi:GNAT family N-acetyltransferase [Promicromonospora iranensis]|uniref:Lysine N-acyltransferase MbtK n=1 Tax=Promicromonospora iranensis TaxID=1105144 RepID=A0ABU2CGS2_9MICO|nr:GNAT family N-acetyltransferase [Promicromonospora iranensis]MDR7380538.1 penicillin amidase [Promicromonospora iranensis]
MMENVDFDLFRDDLGIPHVRAASETALAYGQGWVTAQDRGLQIEADRMRAEERYAEVAGPAGAAWDRFAARERLAATARRIHDALDRPEQEWLAAYADGVSDGLLAGGRDVPELAGVPHRPWRPWTPIGVFLAAHVLFNGFPSILWRAHVARHLHVPGVPLEQVLGLFAADAGPSSGSNAWAVHGSFTESGSPLVAGDPHRTLELPGPYQQVRLVCTDPDASYDVLGLAFPGVPGIPHFGHAGSVAWGITNAAAHHVEVVADGADGAGPGGWHLHWPARELSDVGVASWRALLHARTAGDVADAFSRWVDPVNRVLTADSTGEVLSLTAGKVPAAADRALPAAKPADGYVDLPVPVPVTQVAVDANERPRTQARAELDGRPGLGPRDTRPGREAHDLGWSYAPHRAERIRQLLAAGTVPESPETQGRIHGDTRDLGAPGLVEHLAADTSAAAARLRAWVADGAHVDATSTDAALYMRWRDALTHRLAGHPVLAALHEPHGQDPAFAAVLGGVLDVPTAVGAGLARILAADWLGIDPAAEASAALAEVAGTADRQSAGGADRPSAGGADRQSEPTWGELHLPDPLPPVPSPGDPTADVALAPVSGNNESVRCTGGSPGVAPTAYRGSVARYVWDLADRANSRWGVPFGAAGRPGSVHFDDQHATWADAATTPVVTDWDRLHPADTTLRLLNGARGEEVWRRDFGADGLVTVHMLDPEADADVLHGWFAQPRAAFWGMGGHTRDEVRDTYAFVESLPTHHAYLVRWDGEPVVLLQAYHPEHDPVATAYEVRPGDLGMHFFLGSRGPVARHGSPDNPWTVLGPATREFLFAGPGTRRLVGEPDANNEKALHRMAVMGFTAGERVSYESPQGPKVARMAYLTRERAAVGGVVR